MIGTRKAAKLVAMLAVVLGAAAGLAGVAAADEVVSESREVSDFDEVELQGVGTLIIEQGETEALTIEAEPHVLERIATEVQGDRLTIAPTDSFTTDEPIVYSLTVEELTAIELDGTGAVEASDLVLEELELVVDGTGNVELDDLTADALDVSVAGTGDVEVSGEVDRQEVEIDGSGEYDAEDLESREATVAVDGTGDATVQVSDVLDVRVDGTGNIEYICSPTVSQEIAGTGDLTKIG